MYFRRWVGHSRHLIVFETGHSLGRFNNLVYLRIKVAC